MFEYCFSFGKVKQVLAQYVILYNLLTKNYNYPLHKTGK